MRLVLVKIMQGLHRFDFGGGVMAFTLSTRYARKVHRDADELRAAGEKVILGGIHVAVCPEQAMAADREAALA